jgi:hypothetical protein
MQTSGTVMTAPSTVIVPPAKTPPVALRVKLKSRKSGMGILRPDGCNMPVDRANEIEGTGVVWQSLRVRILKKGEDEKGLRD